MKEQRLPQGARAKSPSPVSERNDSRTAPIHPRGHERPKEQMMQSTLAKFWNDESGQGLTEYALILALVSVGLIAVMVVFRDAIGGIFDRIAQVLEQAPNEGYTPGS